jgi:hypothetical protein
MALASAFELSDGSRPLLEYLLSLKALSDLKNRKEKVMTYKHWRGNPLDDANRNAWATQTMAVG